MCFVKNNLLFALEFNVTVTSLNSTSIVIVFKMVNSCCAFNCTNRFGKDSSRGYFRFPLDPYRRTLWIIAVKRKDWLPSKTSVVCGDHFQTGRPSRDENHPDYVPSVFSFNTFHKKPAKRKKKLLKRTKEEESSLINRESETPLTDSAAVLQQTSEVLSQKFSGDLSLEVPSQTSEDWGETQKSGNLSMVDKGLLAKEKIKELGEEDYTSTIFSRCNKQYWLENVLKKLYKKKHSLQKKKPRNQRRKKINVPLTNAYVCSLHFQDSDFEREISAYDPKTGKTLTAPLDIIRLKKDSIPSIFDISGTNTLVKKNDEEEMNFRKRKISSNFEQNKTSTEQDNSELLAPPELDISVQNESTGKANEKLISKRKRLAENGDSSVKSTLMNNQETSSCNLNEKKDDVLDLLPCSPPVDSDKNMKTEVSRCPPIYSTPLKISNRETAFGKFIASELNSLYPYPELYLQAKRSILGILVQAQFELIKSSSAVS